jgi:hypothetical protein
MKSNKEFGKETVGKRTETSEGLRKEMKVDTVLKEVRNAEKGRSRKQ